MRVLVSFVAAVYLASVLHVDNWGIVAGFLSLGTMGGFFIQYGFFYTGPRHVAATSHSADRLRETVLPILIVKCVLVLLWACVLSVLFLVVPFINKYWWFLPGSFVLSLSQGLTLAWYYHGIEKFRRFSLYEGIGRSGSLVVVLLYIRSPEQAHAALTAFALPTLLVTIILHIPLIKRIGFQWVACDKVVMCVRESFHGFLSKLYGVFISTANPFLLTFFLKESQIGNYSLAERAVFAAFMVAGVLSQILMPQFVRGKEFPFKQYWSRFRRALYVSVLLAFATSLLLFACSFILVPILGVEYLRSATLLRWLAWLPLLPAVSTVCTYCHLLVFNKDRWFSRSMFWSMVVNLLGIPLCVSLWEDAGMVIVAYAAQITVTTIAAYYTYQAYVSGKSDSRKVISMDANKC